MKIIVDDHILSRMHTVSMHIKRFVTSIDQYFVWYCNTSSLSSLAAGLMTHEALIRTHPKSQITIFGIIVWSAMGRHRLVERNVEDVVQLGSSCFGHPAWRGSCRLELRRAYASYGRAGKHLTGSFARCATKKVGYFVDKDIPLVIAM